ncbi:adenylate/guanylate cyclase domain-containing protein [Pyxidicoccus parkwayensis]|uniref:Adenylate/guanylate cyclase domain-containing protein n=1 Tax=Pyxidicoccus parkwayensis TaxID=2813578 RepID=A0ABX7NSK5_9BACT|nr:adenylate/guanylate cyclase domain-containing protein [Pyxidicoccus parkwaysis]QSQ21339.1 adenylate/guanylate cyclase domain-containing protein [Pyxidicoccus parkwaysis]
MTVNARDSRMMRGQPAVTGPDVAGWLVTEARSVDSPAALLDGLCQRLVEQGIPLARASISLFTLHPLLHGRSFRWRPNHGASTEVHPHGLQHLPGFALSPFKALLDGSPGIHRRLEDPPAPDDFPMFAELRADGLTDYLALPVCFSDGARHAVSWATSAPGGFTDAHLALLHGLHPLLALVLEVFARKDMTGVLLDTYLGRDTGRRILQGQIRRGDGETTSAVICLSDLRRFTTLSDALPRDALLELLNAYFETMVSAFHSHGAEVLKFIGDAVLAIFRIDADSPVEERCEAAARTVRAALAASSRDNAERRRKGLPTYEFGAALHVGDVMYGNIGASDRLDFTVIGPAVNLADRIGGLCAALNEPVLLSEAFASHFRGGTRDLGEHRLKGVSTPVRIYSLAPEADSSEALTAA